MVDLIFALKELFLWNNLEESLKSLSLWNFKRSLKNDILETYYFFFFFLLLLLLFCFPIFFER